jgi:hypothetical protein
LESIFAKNIPEDELYFLARFSDGLSIDLHADGSLIALGINAFDETADQARLTDGKGAEYADFLFQHRNAG